ncbi:MAG: hypothetical protein Q8P79_01050 [Nanoarchaeota archaeon]|nr:hypothetical protein [Nanoarchaeota archaeon]
MGKKEEYTEIFEAFLKGYPEFPEILDIAKRNARGHGKSQHGRIWVIGGFIYRPIIKSIYPELKVSEQSQIDIDFLIERSPPERDLYLPEDWSPKITEYGNLYLVKGNMRIDLNYLRNFHSITRRSLRPRFKHFFTGTPMDIQSIAYDLTDKNIGVIGETGIKAIKRKIVRINNLEEAQYEVENIKEALKKEFTIEDLVRQKAKELDFGHDLTQMGNPGNHHPDALQVFISPRNTREKIK